MVFGIVEALGYGIGSDFSYIGGRLWDSHSPKKLTILGNSLIPLMSLIGLAGTYIGASALYIGGWWSRNFRNPPPRVMIIQSSKEEDISRAICLLHGLDITGGTIAGILPLSFTALGLPLSRVFLFSIAPLVVSNLLVASTRSVH
ncbi:hypothetical protein [Thermoplasma volcanium]|uniref:hypothetical protein n=1 Tax=Thermoplasma volcanium TaxID=50339 RepID=UPI00064EC4EA|nr:hypothetical protein [Thermoplasma volcanium]